MEKKKKSRGCIYPHGQCVIRIIIIKKKRSEFWLLLQEHRREKLAKAKRKCIEDRVKTIIELKKKVCGDLGKGFVITYQKGIDPFFLNALAKEGIVALCKAKSRNMLVVG